MTAGSPTTSRAHTTSQPAADHQADRIARLFAEGHGIDFVCERGHYAGANGWNRARVLEVVSQRGWTLDGSGRVPRPARPAITPGQPVPRMPSGKTQIGAINAGRPPVVPAPRPSPGRAQVTAMLEQPPGRPAAPEPKPAAKAATTKTPTEGAASTPTGTQADAAGTAPESAPVTGRRAPDAAPQVSPSRTHTGNDGELGASDAPAEPPVTAPLLPHAAVDRAAADLARRLAATGPTVDQQRIEQLPVRDLLEHAAAHHDERIRHLADRARILVADIRAALTVDAEKSRLRARLAELDAERDVILARLAEPAAVAVEKLVDAVEPVTPQRRRTDKPDVPASGKHGTWGGFLAHRYRGETVAAIEAQCPPCFAAKASRGRKAA